MPELDATLFDSLRETLRSICGIDVPPSKRYLFTTRLRPLMAEGGIESYGDLQRRLSSNTDPKLRERVVDAMTTNETSFFRDGYPYAALISRILPHLIEVQRARSGGLPARMRVLSAGCSTGEEPYTLAVCLHEFLAQQSELKREHCQILAVDIDNQVLSRARAGRYSDAIVRNGMPFGFLKKYFVEKDGSWVASPTLKSLINFHQQNLSVPFRYLGSFDLIFCRNVVIYFDVELKTRILAQIHDMLHPQGVLVMGATESVYQLSDRFESVSAGRAAYYVKKSSSLPMF